jgi:hypothetical protein
LNIDRIESARACAFAISGLVANTAAQHPEAYIIADLHERLEMLARAADALGRAPVAINIRAMIQQPATVNDADWPQYLAARQNRLRELDRELQDRHGRYRGIRDDPVFELQRIRNRGAAPSQS